MGWWEKLSARAAYSTSSSFVKWLGITFCTSNTPSVKVPVLSQTTVVTSFKYSKYVVPLTKIPNLEATPIPLKKLRGTEITKAQGQETTKKDKAR